MEPNFKEDITHVDIIKHLIVEYGFKSYLEIGVQGKVCWDQIECLEKVGVEPVGDMFDDRIKSMTSDQFFALNNSMFDLIFIDGDHDEPQVSRDIENALSCLNHGGAIVLHDAYPPSKDFTVSYRCGTVYRSVWNIRHLKNIGIVTYTGDFGVAVIRPKPSVDLYGAGVGTYEEYIRDSKNIINKYDFYSEFKVGIRELFLDD
jgi:hypothetical protein